jgi:hypothetical protein
MLLVEKHQQRRLMVVALFIMKLVKTNSGEKAADCSAALLAIYDF